MHQGRPLEPPPPRPEGVVSPWVEISAWILAFAILLAAQCAPDHATLGPDAPQSSDARGR